MKRGMRWAAIVLGFLWMTFVYASFYLVQNQRPLSGANLRALLSTGLDLATAGGMLAVGVGLGDRVLELVGIRPRRSAERVLMGAGVGLGVVSFLMLGIGLTGLLRRWVVALTLGAAALIALPRAVTLAHGLSVRPDPLSLSRALRLYLWGTFVLALLLALTPTIDWDGLFYHLTMPRLYLQQGRIAPITDVPHQYFPGLMEMLYLAAMSLRGDVAAKLLHLGYALLLGWLLYLLAERHLGKGYGLPTVVLYAAMPMVPLLGGWAYNDLALGFYQMAALYAFLAWRERGERRWLAMMGVMCGLAMGLKYTAFVCPLAMAAGVGWHLLRRRAGWREWGRGYLLWGGMAALVAAPWYVRNLAFTGNPVYPFAYGVFDGRGWDAWRAAWYARVGSGLGWDWWSLFKLPWTLTLGLRDMNFYDGRMGPLFLLALPFLLAWVARLFGRPQRRPAAIGHLLWFALCQYGFWALGVVNSRSLFQSRLLLPAFLALCPPLAYLFDELRALDTDLLSLRRLVGMSVALVLAANLCGQFLYVVRVNPLAVLTGVESRDAFLRRTLGAHYVAMRTIDEVVSPEEKVLFLWEPRSYYCRRPAQPDPILERWGWLLYRHGGDLASIARELHDDGYTHILLYREGMLLVRRNRLDPLEEEDFAAWDEFAGQCLNVEREVGKAYVLYRLEACFGDRSHFTSPDAPPAPAPG